MTEFNTQIRGLDKLRRKARAMPRAARLTVALAIRQNAREFAGDVRGSVTDSASILGSVRNRIVPGTRGLARSVTAGGGEAFHAVFREGGTKAGRRRVSSGRRVGVSFEHPGQRAEPFFNPPYRLKQRRFRARVSRAYTQGIRRVAGNGQ